MNWSLGFRFKMVAARPARKNSFPECVTGAILRGATVGDLDIQLQKMGYLWSWSSQGPGRRQGCTVAGKREE